MKSIVLVSYNTHQREFFEKIKKFVSQNIKAQVLTSNKIFSRAILINKKQFLLSDEETLDALNYSYIKLKARYGLKNNNQISKFYKKYLFYKSRLIEAFLYKFLKDNNVELLIVWNGEALEAATPVMLARKMGIKTIFMENGYFSGTIVMDTKGVNAKNSLPRNNSFYENIPLDSKKLKVLTEINLEYRNLRGQKYLDNSVIENEKKQLPDKYMFLPFQVHTDTQVLVNSPFIKDMEHLLELVYNSIEEYNIKYGDNYRLVVKEHPSDHGRVNYSQIKKEYGEKGVIFLTKIPVEDILDNARVVITLNSTVGIEALLRGKTVITLGDAFYNIKDIVYHVNDICNISNEIRNALHNGVNKELIDKFLYFLRYEYLVESGKNDNNKKENQVVDRIIDILEGKKYKWM